MQVHRRIDAHYLVSHLLSRRVDRLLGWVHSAAINAFAPAPPAARYYGDYTSPRLARLG